MAQGPPAGPREPGHLVWTAVHGENEKENGGEDVEDHELTGGVTVPDDPLQQRDAELGAVVICHDAKLPKHRSPVIGLQADQPVRLQVYR
jgi:hypothetical protein